MHGSSGLRPHEAGDPACGIFQSQRQTMLTAVALAFRAFGQQVSTSSAALRCVCQGVDRAVRVAVDAHGCDSLDMGRGDAWLVAESSC